MTDSQAFDDLLGIVERLRDPGGCPWDREQTHASLRPQLLEECYEVLEAIDNGDTSGLAEELGDLLTHIVFHADIARRAGEFTMADVVAGVIEKLKRRHPHVFGDGPVLETSGEVISQWDRIKRAERTDRKSITDGVPEAQPALAYAAALLRRTERAGIDVHRAESTGAAYHQPRRGRFVSEREAGDYLLTVARQVQATGVDPETALRAAALRFRDRVRRAEAAAGGRALSDLPVSERSRLWAESAES